MGTADADLALADPETSTQQTPLPPLYRVILINDDYTPMDFVVDVLQTVFGMDEIAASTVMMAIHQKGQGVCGVFGRDVADTKAEWVRGLARQNGHPLSAVVEQAPSAS